MRPKDILGAQILVEWAKGLDERGQLEKFHSTLQILNHVRGYL
jgi:hypothetical protein